MTAERSMIAYLHISQIEVQICVCRRQKLGGGFVLPFAPRWLPRPSRRPPLKLPRIKGGSGAGGSRGVSSSPEWQAPWPPSSGAWISDRCVLHRIHGLGIGSVSARSKSPSSSSVAVGLARGTRTLSGPRTPRSGLFHLNLHVVELVPNQVDIIGYP